MELAVASARELALVAGFKMLSAANAAKANARSRKELVLATEQPVERGGIYLIQSFLSCEYFHLYLFFVLNHTNKRTAANEDTHALASPAIAITRNRI